MSATEQRQQQRAEAKRRNEVGNGCVFHGHTRAHGGPCNSGSTGYDRSNQMNLKQSLHTIARIIVFFSFAFLVAGGCTYLAKLAAG